MNLGSLAFLFVFFLVVSCGQGPRNSTNIDAPKSSHPRLSSEFRRAEYRSQIAATGERDESDTLDVESYSLKGTFDWTKKVFTAEVAIRLHVFDADSNFIDLDNQVHRILSVTSVHGTQIPFEVLASKKLRIPLDGFSSAQKTTGLEIRIRYETRANSLEAGDRVGLQLADKREGDPIPSKALYTHSEPLAASTWMPCHDVPYDRATFSMEMQTASNQTLVANGKVIRDTWDPNKGIRTMAYKTDFTLPTYLMAFAVGEFEVSTRYLGNLPVSLIHRRGLSVDRRSVLGMLVRQMALYQRLLGPYPFGSYALVLLPEFSTGMEHVGITFEEEVGSLTGELAHDHWLSAHEMAHEWFGDLVTVKEWDDLWIKEGMATLMAEEASRLLEDSNHTGRLFGRNFIPDEGDAIRDPELPPDEKYTSGPYDRSAWFFTQLRAQMGDERFWSTWRRILKKYSYSAIGTRDILSEFSQELSAVSIPQLEAALRAKAMPRWVTKSRKEGVLEAIVEDPEASLLTPVEVRLYRAPKDYTSYKLNQPMEVSSADAGVLVLDPSDIHPMSVILGLAKRMESRVGSIESRLWPNSPNEREAFRGLGPNVLTTALEAGFPRTLTPAELRAYFDRAGSQESRFRLIQTACALAGGQEETAKQWTGILLGLFNQIPYYGIQMDNRGRGLTGCESPALRSHFLNALNKIRASPTLSYPIERVNVLSRWHREPSIAFNAWSAAATRSPNIGIRVLALEALRDYFDGSENLQPTGAEKEKWRKFFLGVLSTSQTSELLKPALGFLKMTQDKAVDAREAIANVVIREVPWRAQVAAMCTAHSIGKEDVDYLKSMRSLLPSDLSPIFEGALFKGSGC